MLLSVIIGTIIISSQRDGQDEIENEISSMEA
jgi:hypothetical protein